LTHPSSGWALELEGVALSFGERHIFESLDLRVRKGERVALIGPSGVGKTSLLRMATGVLRPSRGSVRSLGEDVGSLSGRGFRYFRRRVGMLYQSDNLVAPLRVIHNVLMGRLGAWSWARALLSLFWPLERERAAAALRRVELEDRLWDLPSALSGGERQRVAIARLIVQAPELVLADEPASSLDPRLGQQIIRLLAELATEHGSTLIVSLHTLDLLEGNFDRVVALGDGGICWEGSPDALTRERLREIYGADYQQLLLGPETAERGGP
jgi:phosphonate transport system ATP-binding protein